MCFDCDLLVQRCSTNCIDGLIVLSASKFLSRRSDALAVFWNGSMLCSVCLETKREDWNRVDNHDSLRFDL